MAYIIGLITPEEEQELKARGWEVEDAPEAGLRPPEREKPGTYTTEGGERDERLRTTD